MEFRRAGMWLGLMGLAVVVGLVTGRWLKQPTLYPGDRVETRECRDCGGSGRMIAGYEGGPQTETACDTCAGRGKVQVILPGPNRPVWVKGAVVDAARAGSLVEDPPMGRSRAPWAEPRWCSLAARTG